MKAAPVYFVPKDLIHRKMKAIKNWTFDESSYL